ncbi:MAG: secreted protein [Pseudonocardia sp.]|nr:secreted protein [Pseudonocardia sp.]
MRERIEGSHPRLTRARVMTGVTAALVAISVGVAGCSGDPGTSDTSEAGPSSAAAPAPHVEPMAKSKPVRMQIPAISVNSDLMDLGLQADGTMQVPSAGFPAGWYTGAPTPGQLGPAIIAGHVDWGGHPGVFYRLRDLKPGDQITVERQDRSTAVFRVTRVEQFPKDKFPTDVVYGDLDHAGLRLITCGGSFDSQARSYVDNIIAFADLVAA